MATFDWTAGVAPTTYGAGPFHPAVRNGKVVYYWPNITMATEEEACEWAKKSLDWAFENTQRIMSQWNVYRV